MSNHLNSGKINIGQLKDQLKRELVDFFAKFKGAKTLVWDKQLVGSFGLITEYSYLKQNGVVQMFMLDTNFKAPNTDHVIYFIKPQVSKIKQLIENFNKTEAQQKNFHLVYVPEKNFLCEKILEKNDITPFFKSIQQFQAYFYPFDCDVLSMEDEYSFFDCNLNEDYFSIYNAACGLIQLQQLFGIIPTIYGQGKNSKVLCDLLIKKRKEYDHKIPKITNQIDGLIILDRSIDLISPLITQLTYEGLLDEIFGIKNNNVKLPASKFNQKDETEDKNLSTSDLKQFTLNSSEELYSKIRDKNFNAVPLILNNTSKFLRGQYDERHTLKSVTDYKSFVDKLPHLQSERKSLTNHLLIAELITEIVSSHEFREKIENEQNFIDLVNSDKINTYIEDCIARNEPLKKVLRLICLQSQVNNGLKPKVLSYYQKEIVQTYGYHHIINIDNLMKCGLLRTNTIYTKGFSNIKKSMGLTVENLNEKNPTDIAYVHSYYAPITARLCQYLISPGWKLITDITKQLPEPFFEETQEVLNKKQNDENKLVIVFFIGGCTYAEIAALRFLSQQDDVNAEFIVATTKIINGDSFIESMLDLKI